MTQEKMRRIITACVSAATVLFTFLSAYLAYQWITMAVLDNRIKKLEEQNAVYEQLIEEGTDQLKYLESEQGKEWLAIEMGLIKDKSK